MILAEIWIYRTLLSIQALNCILQLKFQLLCELRTHSYKHLLALGLCICRVQKAYNPDTLAVGLEPQE